MYNGKKTRKKKIITGIGVAALVCCTVIGGYGIFHAPASDQPELEQELLRREQALEENQSMPPSSAAATAQTPATGTEQATGNGQANETGQPGGNGQAEGAGLPGETGQPSETEQPARSISVIGDSVFLGASPSFQELHKDAVIDAKISRQVWQAADVAKKLNKKGKLGDTVIISLGTNSKFNPATGQELLDYLGADRTIYWINAYGKNLEIQSEVNDTISKLAKKNDNVHVIAWDKEGKKHPDWFYQDGVHLNEKGQSGFAEFVEKAING